MTLIVILYGFINLLFALFLIKIEAKRNSPFVLMWVSLSIIYFVPSITDVFLGYVSPHQFSVSYYLTEYVILKSQLFVFIWMLAYYLVTSFMFKGNKFNLNMKGASQRPVDKYVFGTVFFISFLSLFYYVRTFGFSNVITMGFLDFREVMPFYIRAGLIYTQFFIVGMALYYYVQGRYKLSVLTVLYLLFLFSFVGGSRQPLAILALAFFFLIFQSKRNNYKYYVFLVMLSSPFIYIMQVLLHLRNLVGLEAKLDYIAKGGFLTGELVTSSEQSLRFAFYYFIDTHGKVSSFVSFDYFFRTLLAWLPGSIAFGMKPDDFEVKMFEVFMPGYTGTMHPLLFGSVVADSGWFFLPWVILISFISVISKVVLDNLQGGVKCLYIILLCACAVMYARGAIYGMTVMLFYSSLLFLLINKVWKR